MAGAQARWPFLAHFEAYTVKNERKHVTTVRERCYWSKHDAEADVRQWMQN